MYHIVCFSAKGEVDIVHDSWLLDSKEHSYFPHFMTPKLKRALQTAMSPEESWTIYKIKILKSYDTYEKAYKMLPVVELMSNLESDFDESVPRKRQKVTKVTTSSSKSIRTSEADDRDRISDMTSHKTSTLPAIVKIEAPDISELSNLVNQHNQSVSTPSSRETDMNRSDVSMPNQISRTSQSNQNSSNYLEEQQNENAQPVYTPEILSRVALSIQEQGDSIDIQDFPPSSTRATVPVTTPFQKNVLKWMEKMEMALKENSKILKEMQAQLDSQKSLEKTLEDIPNLPLSTQEEMKTFEEYLEDQSNFAKMVQHLAAKGGKNIFDATRRIVTGIMEPGLAACYNWAEGGEKIAIKDTRVTQLIIYAVREIKTIKNFDEKVIEEQIKAILKYAPLRSSYVSQRKNFDSPDMCRMEKVEESMKVILPNISSEELKKVTQLLVDLVVDNIDHLDLVNEEDFSLRKLQARLLVRGRKRKEADKDDESDNEQSIDTIATEHEAVHSPVCVNEVRNGPVCEFNARKFSIPWNSMPDQLLRSLDNNERPKPSLRRQMIRIISDSMCKIIKRPGRQALGIVAERIVEKYPLSFSDDIGAEINGTSHLSILNQLEARVDNLSRSKVINTLRKSAQYGNGNNSNKLRSSEGYGCINYWPYLPIHETKQSQMEKKENMKLIMHSSGIQDALDARCRNLLLETYSSIRTDINSGGAIHNLIEEWPLLFVKEGFLDHFKELVGVNIEEKLSMAISKKGIAIISYFLDDPKLISSSKEKFKNLIAQFKRERRETKEDLYTWETLVTLLMTYFDEKIEELLVFVEISPTANEKEMIIPKSPCLICFGDQLKNAQSFMLAVDSRILMYHISKFQDGLALLFSAFYNLNIDYPSSAAITLEFIQRCFLDINPTRGSKVSSSSMAKRKWVKTRCGVHPRIISLKKKITEYESQL